MALRLNYTASSFRICVDQSSDCFLSGRIVSQRLKKPLAFHDINNLVSQIDAVMDAQAFPQAFQRIRTFSNESSAAPKDIPAALSIEEMMSKEAVAAECGDRITFVIYIKIRQNASWQGSIDWLDGRPRQNFGSTLEFLKFLDARIATL